MRRYNDAKRLMALIALASATTAWSRPPDMPAYPPPVDPVVVSSGFDAMGIQLLSNIRPRDLDPNSSQGNDCWGYVSPAGREYAIIGLDRSTVFVEITTPTQPEVVAVFRDNSSIWSDIKVYRHWAYNMNESSSGGGNGIQVFDLVDIDNGNVTLVREFRGAGLARAHNVVIDTVSGFLYAVGSNIQGGGLAAFDLADPALPVFAGGWSGRYVHDAQVVTYDSGKYAGREIAFCCTGGQGLQIVDVTDKSEMTALGSETYPGLSYAHQGWLSEDRRYFYMGDEADEGAFFEPTRTLIIDVTDLDNPTFVHSFSSGTESIDHNLYVRGHLIYEANYTTGLRIFDATDPLFPVEVAYFDTYPPSNGRGFAGAWSNFPYFPSGVVIVSDGQRGLFVLSVCSVLNCRNPPVPRLTNAAYDSKTGCGHFLWNVQNENVPGGPAIETFYLDVEAGAGAGQCAAMTPPAEWSVELCDGYDENGHALYRFHSGPPIPLGSAVSGLLTIDTNGLEPWTNPQTGITVPILSIVIHAAQDQDDASCDFTFGPSAAGEWSELAVGTAFLPVPSMSMWAKTLLFVLVAGGGVCVARRRFGLQVAENSV